MSLHESWMKYAIEQARLALAMGEVPVGAIIVRENKIISEAFNTSILNSDPTAHAEINAIRRASNEIKNYRLNGSILYVTLEPCAMCYGAIVQARIAKVVYGALDSKSGVCSSCINLNESKCFNHKPKVVSGILSDECSRILKDFFQARRD